MEVVDFLANNWQWISSIIITIISLLFVIFKKPYKVYGYYLDFVKWVTEAENKYGSGHGKDKLEYVYQKYIEKYRDTNYVFAHKLVESAVNEILDTPQRKVNFNEKVK